MQIKFIGKDIMIDKQCLNMGVIYPDQSVEKVYHILNEIKDPVLFDVGANVGVFSLIAALNQDLTVYSFEPFSKVCALLKKNIYLNGLDNRVKVFEKGLFDRKGVEKLKCCEGQNSGMSCMGPNFQLKIPYVEREVNVDTVDNIVEK